MSGWVVGCLTAGCPREVVSVTGRPIPCGWCAAANARAARRAASLERTRAREVARRAAARAARDQARAGIARACVDCRADIRARPPVSKRCKACQARFRAGVWEARDFDRQAAKDEARVGTIAARVEAELHRLRQADAAARAAGQYAIDAYVQSRSSLAGAHGLVSGRRAV